MGAVAVCQYIDPNGIMRFVYNYDTSNMPLSTTKWGMDTMIDKLIEPDVLDEVYWYRIQTFGKWYVVQACCRKCATHRLHSWTFQSPLDRGPLGEVKTIESPKWLISLDPKE